MNRTALFIALLALPGCLTECGAIGHGVVGRGAVSDGAVGGGAVGGRPAGAAVTDERLSPPGFPYLWYEPERDTEAVDSAAVSELFQLGHTGKAIPVQATGTRQPAYSIPCGAADGDGPEDRACIVFDGSDDWLSYGSGFALTYAQPNLIAGLVRNDADARLVFFDSEHTNAHAVGFWGDSDKFFHAAPTNVYSTSTYPTTGEYHFVCSRADDSGTPQLYVDGAVESTTSPGAGVLDGFFIGAASPLSLYWNGAVLGWWVYDDPDGDGVTCDSLYEGYVKPRFNIGDLGTPNYVDCARPSSSVCPQTGVCNHAFVGDSLVQGTQPDVSDRDGMFEPMFVDLAKPACHTRFNYGVSGTTSSTWKANQWDVAAAKTGQVDVLWIWGPSNDITSTSGAVSWANVKAIVDDALDNDGVTSVVVVGTHQQAARAGFTAAWQTAIDDFRALASAYTKAGYTYVNPDPVLDANGDKEIDAPYDDGTGFHFNSAGEQAFAPTLSALVE